MVVSGFGPEPYEPKKPKKKAAPKKPAPKPVTKPKPPVVPPKPAPVPKPVSKPAPAPVPPSKPTPPAVPPPSKPPVPVPPPITRKGATFGDLTPEALASIEFWIGRGWAPFKAIAVTAHAQVESYWDLRTEVVGDKHIPAEDGIPAGSIGIFQWNKDRKKGLFHYAKRTGQNPLSRVCQMEFAAYELNTSEKFAGNELAKAATLWEAVCAWMHYERPAGWSKTNPTNGSHWHKRLDTAIKLRDNYRKYVEWKLTRITVG